MTHISRTFVPATARPTKPSAGIFPPTNQLLIREGTEPGAQGRAAFGELLEQYKYAIRFLVQRRGLVAGMTADDLHQEFVLHLATPTSSGESRLSEYDPVKGRFRNWLSRVVQNKMYNLKRQASSQTSGQTVTVPYGDALPEVSARSDFPTALPQDLEDDLALAEAYGYCQLALERLRLREPEARFAELRHYLVGVPVGPSRAAISAKTGAKPNTVTRAIGRLRQRFVVELSQVVSERYGSAFADPSLDGRVRKERDRIIQLILDHEWAPRGATVAAEPPVAAE